MNIRGQKRTSAVVNLDVEVMSKSRVFLSTSNANRVTTRIQKTNENAIDKNLASLLDVYPHLYGIAWRIEIAVAAVVNGDLLGRVDKAAICGASSSLKNDNKYRSFKISKC